MEVIGSLTVSHLNTDIKRYAQAMPEYQEPLHFLQGILDFQIALAEKLESSSADWTETGLRIETAVASEKWQTGQPLFAGETLSIPLPLFREALVSLRSLLPPDGLAQMALDTLLDSRPQIGDLGLRIGAFTVHIIEPETVAARASGDVRRSETEFRKLETWIQHLADATSNDPNTLAFMLRTVLSPFFEQQAAPYRQWVETAAWRRGVCPVCGFEPWMARLGRDSGRRILACPLCRTEWAFDRLRCPFCDGDDQPQVRHFTVDDEAHRVYCCDRCQRYIKTVDERVSGRPANLAVEDVITAHLDVMASELGYQ